MLKPFENWLAKHVGSICSKHNNHCNTKRKLDVKCLKTMQIPHKVLGEALGKDIGNFL